MEVQGSVSFSRRRVYYRAVQSPALRVRSRACHVNLYSAPVSGSRESRDLQVSSRIVSRDLLLVGRGAGLSCDALFVNPEVAVSGKSGRDRDGLL